MRLLSVLAILSLPLFTAQALASDFFDKKIDGVEYACRNDNGFDVCVWKQRPDWVMLEHDKNGNLLINWGDDNDGRCWWLNSEFGKKKQSTVFFLEVQCKQWRYRVLQTTVFSKPMMEGKSKNVKNYEEWQYPIPNTMADVMMQLECDKFR